MSNEENPPPVPPMAQVYQTGSARPGLLTAIGIVSILLAAWFILMSVIMVGYMFLMAAIPMTTVSTTTAPTGGRTTPTFNNVTFEPELSTVTWMCVANGLNFFASIILLIAGIAVLKNRRAGEWLHKRWAVAKIFIVILLVIAEWMYFKNFYDVMFQLDMQPGQANPLPPMLSTIMSAIVSLLNGLFSLAYPVTLLFLLRMRSIREYFRNLAG